MKEGGNKGFDAILSDISNSENLFWKGIPMEMVIEHFKVLLKSENKYGIPFLTTEQFISFLKRGFLNNKSEPKQKINCPPLKKVLVIKRFREFYDKAVELGHPQQRKKFIDLVTECFVNWDKKSVDLLLKPGKTKADW